MILKPFFPGYRVDIVSDAVCKPSTSFIYVTPLLNLLNQPFSSGTTVLSEKDFFRNFNTSNDFARETAEALRGNFSSSKRVAEIIGCSRKTVLNGGAGTARLTRIRNGSTQVRFILEEVLAFAGKQERDATTSKLLDDYLVTLIDRLHYLLLTTILKIKLQA